MIRVKLHLNIAYVSPDYIFTAELRSQARVRYVQPFMDNSQTEYGCDCI